MKTAKEILYEEVEKSTGTKVKYNITEKGILIAMEKYALQFNMKNLAF